MDVNRVQEYESEPLNLGVVKKQKDGVFRRVALTPRFWPANARMPEPF
jgi:hypothetical protein